MLINSENGSIELESFATRLYKGMPLNQLKETDFYKVNYHNMWDVKTGYFWYYFKTTEVKGYQLYLSLCFFEDRLHSLHMNTWEISDAKDWNGWTEEKEIQVFHRNNRFLTLLLGISPTWKRKTPYPGVFFRFSWGNIWSVYDPRSASSLMGISYDEKNIAKN
ncbi:hypothetical protein HX13_14150 [Chryseobacterium sp. P1-3]|uniref:hypothetical protein n=1 Tax=Chryseobacterium sp. (strain P1-3) TaxID=1517683 RepID=UPI0004E7001B|nr:hypothetical protein [Chryseobacterium sp. P1-3]KFF74260.1 hypothetical protein HX13_14150 [Chryseobacterium sp. P1-3]